MSKLTWKLQSKFVDKVLKGESLFWDFSQKDGIYVFGDSYHFYVIPMEEVFIDFIKLDNYNGHLTNLHKMNLIDGYKSMNFDANATVCNEVREILTLGKRTTKNYVRKFEYLDKEVWISENYLNEFDYMKDPEPLLVLADSRDGFKKPVRFDGDDFTAVILPVRIMAPADDDD